MCWVRYDGIDCCIASTSALHGTSWVSPQNAPRITIDAAIEFPASVATAVASTRCTVTSGRTACVNVVSLTISTPPGRSLASTGPKNSSCIAIADHVCDTTGGASIGASATTTVLSVLPPRIMPP